MGPCRIVNAIGNIPLWVCFSIHGFSDRRSIVNGSPDECHFMLNF
jgi:hypothetical protein